MGSARALFHQPSRAPPCRAALAPSHALLERPPPPRAPPPLRAPRSRSLRARRPAVPPAHPASSSVHALPEPRGVHPQRPPLPLSSPRSRSLRARWPAARGRRPGGRPRSAAAAWWPAPWAGQPGGRLRWRGAHQRGVARVQPTSLQRSQAAPPTPNSRDAPHPRKPCLLPLTRSATPLPLPHRRTNTQPPPHPRPPPAPP